MQVSAAANSVLALFLVPSASKNSAMLGLSVFFECRANVTIRTFGLPKIPLIVTWGREPGKVGNDLHRARLCHGPVKLIAIIIDKVLNHFKNKVQSLANYRCYRPPEHLVLTSRFLELRGHFLADWLLEWSIRQQYNIRTLVR